MQQTMQMKPVLNLVTLLLAATLFSCTSSGEEKSASGGKTDAETSGVVKVHQCTETCKAGEHQFAHNEVGHTCSSDCGRPHQCAEQCSGDTHVYAHGEVSHYCMCVPG